MTKKTVHIILVSVILTIIVNPPLVLGESQTVVLEPGWNLISLQLEPYDANLTAVLAGIEPNYLEVWTYDSNSNSWVGYQRTGIQTLSEIHGGRGYWIRMDPNLAEADYLKVTGVRIPASIGLADGWNLVGPFSQLPLDIQDAYTSDLNNVDGQIWGWDSAADIWLQKSKNVPEFLNTLPRLDPGDGYWIYTAAATTWKGPVLQVSVPAEIAFGTGPTEYTLRLYNVGATGQQLNWTASSTQNWVVQTPSAGTIGVGQVQNVTISADLTGLAFPTGDDPIEYNSVLNIHSNGGDLSLPVIAKLWPLNGHYEGFATPLTVNNREVSLPNIRLGIDVNELDGRAVLTAEQTPFFVEDVYFMASRNVTDLVLASRFSVDPNQGGTDMFGQKFVRSMVMRGAWVTNLQVDGSEVGDYVETLEIPGGDPIVIRGIFQLTRIGSLDPLLDPNGVPRRATARPDKDDPNSDGMPDDWEIRFGLDPHNGLDWGLDSDGDGRNNYEEYLDRTDPKTYDDEPEVPSISGTVVDGNDPVPNVIVTLHFAGFVMTTITDANGQYSFENLVPGCYKLSFSPRPGFSLSPTNADVDIDRDPGTPNTFDVSASRQTTAEPVDFIAAPLTGNEPLDVQFVMLAESANSWNWQFGDGESSVEKDPLHTYQQPGEYDVTLTITDPNVGSEVKLKYIRVGVPQTDLYKLVHDVHAIHGGHPDPNDPNSYPSEHNVWTVIGTAVAEDNEPSSNYGYRLWVDDVP